MLTQSVRRRLRRIADWGTARRHAISGVPQVKVYGILRSGTNYLSALLETNYRLRSLGSTEEGWKHGPIQTHPNVLPVLIVRDPYTWITSFYEWERIHNRTYAQLDDFIALPVTHPRLGECWNASSPIDAWNKALSSWIVRAEELDVPVIRYEDLLSNFETQLIRIEGRYLLRRRATDLVNITDRVDTWRTPNPRSEFTTRTGSSKEAPLDSEVIRLVNGRLDRGVVETLGYHMRS